MLRRIYSKLPYTIRVILGDFIRRRRDISYIKTILWSIRYKNPICISRYTDIRAGKKSLVFRPNSGLHIGLRYHNPTTRTTVLCGENAKIIIDGDVSIYKGCYLSIMDEGILQIGDGTYLNEGCRIQCREKIQIGKHCAIAWNVNILDTDEHTLINNGGKSRPMKNEIIIGDHVWIGCNTTILKGVQIGDGAVIAAGAVVTHDVRSNTLAVGVPAKVIKENISWR